MMGSFLHYVATHAVALAKVFLALAALLLLGAVAMSLWPRIRPPRKARPRSDAPRRGDVDPSQWSLEPGRESVPRRSTEVLPARSDARPEATPRPAFRAAAAQPGVLELDARIDGIQKALESRMLALEGRIEIVQQMLEARSDVAAAGHSSLTGDGSPSGASAGGDAFTIQPVTSAAGSQAGGGFGATGGGRVPVEIRDGAIVPSQSLPPEAWLVPQGGGRASLSLNAEVLLNTFALDRFSYFFDLGDRREGFYETRRPAEVAWDDGQQRGSLVAPGKAVAR
jgi:hypothetical protein